MLVLPAWGVTWVGNWTCVVKTTIVLKSIELHLQHSSPLHPLLPTSSSPIPISPPSSLPPCPKRWTGIPVVRIVFLNTSHESDVKLFVRQGLLWCEHVYQQCACALTYSGMSTHNMAIMVMQIQNRNMSDIWKGIKKIKSSSQLWHAFLWISRLGYKCFNRRSTENVHIHLYFLSLFSCKRRDCDHARYLCGSISFVTKILTRSQRE